MKVKAVLVAAAAMVSVQATAAPILLATGQLNGATDLSGLTGTLENGLAGNVLGGLGSGLAYVGGNSFLALPDRGPNATTYNAAVDNTVSYISRFQSVTLALTPQSGTGLPFGLSPQLTGTTLLYSPDPLIYGTGAGLGTKADGSPLGSGSALLPNAANQYYFSGRSDNFGPGGSGNPLDARLDPESIRVSADGRSVFISDEYGPYIRQFDKSTGQLLRTYTLPANLDVALVSAHGTDEEANASGRVDNKGMEGLALTPDGKTLVGIMQAPLLQDATNASKLLRIVTVDVATGATREYGYTLTTGSGVSEIVALNDHQFLVDERDGKGLGDGSNAAVKSIFLIDITGATDISNVAAGLGTGSNATPTVKKYATPFLDIVAALKANGFTAAQIPAKIEGLAIGQDVTLNGQLLHTLFVANDNDFLPAANQAGPNRFFVFGFTDNDVALAAGVPEPATWGMMILGFGGVGAALRRRARRPATA